MADYAPFDFDDIFTTLLGVILNAFSVAFAATNKHQQAVVALNSIGLVISVLMLCSYLLQNCRSAPGCPVFRITWTLAWTVLSLVLNAISTGIGSASPSNSCTCSRNETMSIA
jgi:hypothetical protein